MTDGIFPTLRLETEDLPEGGEACRFLRIGSGILPVESTDPVLSDSRCQRPEADYKQSFYSVYSAFSAVFYPSLSESLYLW